MALSPETNQNPSATDAAKVDGRKTRAKRGEGQAPATRPAYIVYTLDESGNLTVNLASRKADEVLEHVDQNPGAKYARFKI